MNVSGRRSIEKFLCWSLVIQLALASTVQRANATAPTTQTQTPGQQSSLQQQAKEEDELAKNAGQSDDQGRLESDYNKVCGGDSGKPKVVAGGKNDIALKEKYCEAAKTALEAAKSNDMKWKILVGVAAVCTGACVTPGVTDLPLGLSTCSAANIGGQAASAVITKDYMGFITGVGMSLGMGAVMGGSSNSADKEKYINDKLSPAAKAQAEQEAAASKNLAEERAKAAKEYRENEESETSACLTAAMTAFQAYQTNEAVKTQLQSAKNNIKSAADIQGDRDKISAVDLEESASPRPNASPSDAPSAAPSTIVAKQEHGPSGGGSGGGFDSGFEAAQQAAASDSGGSSGSLPDAGKDPKLKSEFEKAVKQPMDDFFKEHPTASSALAAAVPAALAAAGASLSPGQQNELSSHLDKIGQAAIQSAGGAGESYSGGGSGGGGGGNIEDDALEEAMMNRLKSGSKDLNVGVNIQEYAGRNPARKKAIEDDPTVNIFDRITVRYQILNKRYNLVPRPIQFINK